MNIEIANRLTALRKQKGLSQEDLAEQLGISRQAVSKWERAESSPDMGNLLGLAKLYQVSLDELLNMDEDSIENERYAQQHLDPPPIHSGDWNEGTQEDEDAEYHRWKKENGLRSKWNKFPFPVLVAGIYLMMGFFFGWWHPGWLIFLTIPLYYGCAHMFD